VRKQITSLRVRAEAKITNLLNTIREIRRKDRSISYWLFAEFGDLQSALKLAADQGHSDGGIALPNYAVGAALRGEFGEAASTLKALSSPSCAWFKIFRHAHALSDDEVMREVLDFVESTDLCVTSSCGIDAYDGWRAGLKYLINREDFQRAEKWALRHEATNYQEESLAEVALAYVGANDPANAVRVIRTMPRGEKKPFFPGTNPLMTTLRESARLYLAAGKLQEAQWTARTWKAVRGSDLERHEEAEIEAILGNHTAARKIAASLAKERKEDFLRGYDFEAVWLAEMLAGQIEEAKRTEDAASGTMSVGTIAYHRWNSSLPEYRTRAALWRGQSAADALALCDIAECLPHILVLKYAIKQQDLGTAARVAPKRGGRGLLLLAKAYIAANRRDDARRALDAARPLIEDAYVDREKLFMSLMQAYHALGDTKTAGRVAIRGFVYSGPLAELSVPVDLEADIRDAQKQFEAGPRDEAKQLDFLLDHVAAVWVGAFNEIVGFERGLDKQLARLSLKKD
jgi:hypothetical protein